MNGRQEQAHEPGGVGAVGDDGSRVGALGKGELVDVPCPRCGARDAVFRLRLAVSAMVACRACGTTYVNPRVTSEHIEAKLQAWAREDVLDRERLRSAFEPASMEYYRRLLSRMVRHSRSPRGRLLDVGCSTGAFMVVARDAGWSVQGVEIGRSSAAYARETLSLDVTQVSMYELDAVPSSYDAISMIEVIEHLERPRVALDRAYALLKPGGVLLVTTPNFDALYRRLFGSRWWVVNCEDEHIVVFDVSSLTGIIEDAGFEVVSRHMQGLDIAGMLKAWRRPGGTPPLPAQEAEGAVAGYYESRSARAKLKSALARAGVLGLARKTMRFLERTYTLRLSPTYAWGEQLVVVARKPFEGAGS